MPRSINNSSCVVSNPMCQVGSSNEDCNSNDDSNVNVNVNPILDLDPIGWLRGEVVGLQNEICSMKRDISNLQIHQQDFNGWRQALTAY